MNSNYAVEPARRLQIVGKEDEQSSTLTPADKKHIVEWGVKNKVRPPLTAVNKLRIAT